MGTQQVTCLLLLPNCLSVTDSNGGTHDRKPRLLPTAFRSLDVTGMRGDSDEIHDMISHVDYGIPSSQQTPQGLLGDAAGPISERGLSIVTTVASFNKT